jgi:16S rRNA G966 N2-methylase RsmD
LTELARFAQMEKTRKTSRHQDEPGSGVKTPTSVLQLYDAALPSSRSGALFNAFSYPTKISPEAIGLFIATHTAPGALVADVFAGSGTTGVAALLCERPTQSMRAAAKTLGISPSWGPRNAHLFDVSTIGCFVADVMTSPPAAAAFQDAATEFLAKLEARLAGLYDVEDTGGCRGQIRHVIHSEVLTCPTCAATHRLWDVAVQKNPAKFSSEFVCTSCMTLTKLSDCPRVLDSSPDVFGRVTGRRLHTPVEIHGVTNGKKWSRPVTGFDETGGERWRNVGLPSSAPDVVIEWGELRRSGYHSGLERLNHFYTPRNFVAVATALSLADEIGGAMSKSLKLLVLSYNASHATLMTRIVAKTGNKDFAITGAQSGVLYVSGLPVEKNILIGLRRKAKVFTEAFEILHGLSGEVQVHNQSSEQIPLENECVDYVFTDPPFGDYIPYAELNQINELWLDSSTKRSEETVVSRSGGKDDRHYEASMTAIFSEVSRVLKPQGLVTVVFHSAHARIWRALTTSLASAGLRVRATSVLDKVQASFKQTVSTISVKGDPLILLAKGVQTVDSRSNKQILDRSVELARSDRNQDIRPHYSRYLAECLAGGHPIDLDAATFSNLVTSRHVDAA